MPDRRIPDDTDSRRALRHPVSFSAHLRDRGATKFTVKLIDLSLTGFRAESDFGLHEGVLVWLTLPGMAALEATVVWRDGFLYGCLLSTPLHPAVFDHIVTLSER